MEPIAEYVLEQMSFWMFGFEFFICVKGHMLLSILIIKLFQVAFLRLCFHTQLSSAKVDLLKRMHDDPSELVITQFC